MAAIKNSRAKHAVRALRVAQGKARQKTDAAESVKTLERGIATAVKWLDGEHPLDARTVEGAG